MHVAFPFQAFAYNDFKDTVAANFKIYKQLCEYPITQRNIHTIGVFPPTCIVERSKEPSTPKLTT